MSAPTYIPARQPMVEFRSSMKPFTAVAIVIFALVALLQLLRVALGWEIAVNGTLIPIWASVVACAVAATLAVMLWREARSR